MENTFIGKRNLKSIHLLYIVRYSVAYIKYLVDTFSHTQNTAHYFCRSIFYKLHLEQPFFFFPPMEDFPGPLVRTYSRSPVLLKPKAGRLTS